MGGVDRSDRRIMKFSVARKGLRWYIKIGDYMIDVFISNGNILYNLITINDLNLNELVQQSPRTRSRRNAPKKQKTMSRGKKLFAKYFHFPFSETSYCFS